jgi:hypothetical protein
MQKTERASVLLKEETVNAVQRHKTALLRRGFDLSTGQVFRLALYSFSPDKVSERDVQVVLAEDLRRSKPSQKFGRVGRATLNSKKGGSK